MKPHLLTIGIWLTVMWGLPPPWWPTAPADLVAQTAAPDRPAYRFEEIADGVYFASGTGAMTVMSNSLVIVNDDHVMLVDTSVTPAAARALVSQVHDELTDKPIRYVFNSHYHFDHAHGNQRTRRGRGDHRPRLRAADPSEQRARAAHESIVHDRYPRADRADAAAARGVD